MYKVHVGKNTSFFKYLSVAIEFAKISEIWFISAADEVVMTQDDYIFVEIGVDNIT